MPVQIYNDTFTDTNGIALTSHTAELGGTYVAWYGSTAPVVYTALGGTVCSGGGGTNIYRNTVIASSADVRATVTFNYQTSAFTTAGVCARLDAAGTKGYAALYAFADKKYHLFRLGAGGAATLLASSTSTFTYAAGNTPQLDLDVTGTGATVTLTGTVGGASVVTFSDTSADRVVDAGYFGLFFNDTTAGTGMFIGSASGDDLSAASTAPGAPTIGTATAGDGSITGAFTAPASDGGSVITGYTMSVYRTADNTLVTTASGTASPITATGVPNDVQQYVKVAATNAVDTGAQSAASNNVTPTAASNTVTITGPADGKIAPLSSGSTGTATFSLAGTYAGTAPNEWRVVHDGTNTPETGFDWQSFTTAPSAGSFAQTIAGVPKRNGWYNLQVRNSGTPAAITSSGKVGAGAHVGIDGQSNAYLFTSATAYAGDSTLTPSPLLRVTGKNASNAWVAPNAATMNGAIALGNALVAALGCPVALVDGSFDGSGLTMTGNGGQWVPTSGTAYQGSLSAMNAAGGKLIANLWIQGEADAGASVTQSAYYNALGTLISQRRTDLGQASLPYIVVTLARNTAGMADINRERIKLAQVQKCADANVYRVDRMDLPLHTDGVHHTAAGFKTLGERCAQAVLASVGLVAQYRGPSIASAVKVNATTFDLTLTHRSGTDFAPTTGITGLRATDPGAADAVISVSSAVRQSANVIRVVLASAPVGLPVFSNLYGSAPAITGVVKDNSTLALPLEYNAGVTATEGASITRTVTLTMRDDTGPAANLTGMKVSLRLGTGPHDSGAVLYQSAVETTDASGVMTFSFDSADISAGGSALLDVITSDGRNLCRIVTVA